MDLEKVRELVEVLENSSLHKLQLKDGENEIILEKGISTPSVIQYQGAPVPSINVPSAPLEQPLTNSAQMSEETEKKEKYTEVVAPLVGIYYEASSPESAPYVTVGSRVKAGDTLCIIEAMKVLNEIKAPVAGEIKAIYAKNGDVLSYDQILIEIGE